MFPPLLHQALTRNDVKVRVRIEQVALAKEPLSALPYCCVCGLGGEVEMQRRLTPYEMPPPVSATHKNWQLCVLRIPAARAAATAAAWVLGAPFLLAS